MDFQQHTCPQGPSGTPAHVELDRVGFANALATLRNLAVVSEDTALPEAIRERFAAIQAQCERLARYVSSGEKAELEVIAENAASASGSKDEVGQAAEVIRVSASKFHVLAASLPHGRRFLIKDLAREWAAYTKSGEVGDAHEAIARVVARGILEEGSGSTVQRSSKQVSFKGEPFNPIPQHPVKPAEEAGRAVSSTKFEDLYSKILASWPTTVCPTLPTGQRYRDTHADRVLLASLVAQGLGGAEVGQYWTPAIQSHRLSSCFFAATDMSITEFRAHFETELQNDLLSQVKEVVSSIAFQQAGKCKDLPEGQLSMISNQLAKVSEGSYSAEDLENLARAFSIAIDDVHPFFEKVLVASKRDTLSLLKASPLTALLGERTFELVELRTLYDDSLEDCGKRHGITRERVRQIVQSIEAIHPLIRDIVRAKKVKIDQQLLPITDTEMQSLERYVSANPKAAHQEGMTLDPSDECLSGESPADARRRMFLVGFAGRYGSKTAAIPSYPAWIRVLHSYPDRYFEGMVRSIIDGRIKIAVMDFQPRISDEFVRDRLTQTPDVADLSVESVKRYLEALVANPKTSRVKVWRAVENDGNPRRCHRIFEVFEDCVRSQGVLRAQEACAVLSEPWTQPWLPGPQMMSFLGERIVKQQSILKVVSTNGWTLGLASARTAELLARFPSLQRLIPRILRNDESEM